METLIQITTGSQGEPVVSARELHSFLEVKSRFADWFKNRVDKYGFVDGKDFVTLSKNLENGGRELDYALTLDCAKELAMVQSNEKGKQARQYFIECEKQLRQVAEKPTLTNTEALLLQLAQQQTQLLTNQQNQLEQLRTDVQQLQAGGKPTRYRQSLPGVRSAPNQTSRNPQLRAQINQQINAYCERFTAQQSETYRYLYNRLQTVYGLNVYMLTRRSGESLLDAVESYGYLDRLYSLIMAELAYTD